MKFFKDRFIVIYITAVVAMIVLFPIFMIDGHDKFTNEREKFHLTFEDQIHGIDISHHNGLINWKDVAKHTFTHHPLNFVIIKATEGGDFIDPLFAQNWEGAKKANIIRGAYHFFNHTTDPEIQALNYLATVNLESGDFVPVLDLEVDSPKIIEGLNLMERAQVWLDIIEEKTKCRPVIYTNHKIYNKYLKGSNHEHHIWLADYSVYTTDAYSIDKLIMWQHSDGGIIPGISKPVDLNVFYGSTHRFQKFIIK